MHPETPLSMGNPKDSLVGAPSTVIKLSSQQQIDLHRVQIELVAEFRRVCEKHSLKFFALYGTLLGAVRHQGFIPWDDDVDLGMLRADYEKLLDVVKLDLSEKYFFQTFASDEHYASPLGKLRKNKTVFHERTSGLGGQHRGIFIDVFPLDTKPTKKWQQVLQQRSTYVLKRLLMIKGGYEIGAGGGGVRRTTRLLAGAMSKLLPRPLLVGLLNHQMSRRNGCPAVKYISVSGPYSYDRETLDARWVNELVELPFEHTTIPAFRDAHSYLTRIYGDYMILPPKSDRIGHHDLVKLDFGS